MEYLLSILFFTLFRYLNPHVKKGDAKFLLSIDSADITTLRYVIAENLDLTLNEEEDEEDDDPNLFGEYVDFEEIKTTNHSAQDGVEIVYEINQSKGLGNNTNIFPSQVQEFPIPDWDETKQTEIVNKIKTQIDVQKEIDKQIAEKQAEISAIIEKAIQTE